MAFVTLRTNLPNNVLLTQNGVDYIVQYDSTNGEAQIIQRNAPSGTLPIYQNGQWNSSATQIGITPQQQSAYHSETQVLVYSAFRQAGGLSSGARIGTWALPQNFNQPPGQTSTNPSQNPSSQNNGSGQGLNPTGIGILAAFGNLEPAATNFAVNGSQFGVPNESTLFNSVMMYPTDMNVEQQDTLQIIGYRYRPSRASAIFGGTGAAISTLSGGLQTTSNINRQERIGLVILPMPNKVSDSNNVGWGDDTMNNLAAAVTASTLGGGGPIAAAAAGGLSTLLGAGFGAGVAAQQILSLANDGAFDSETASLLLGTSLASKILKAGGYGVETESILARGAGIVPNSNLELLFNGPTLRSFNFSYRLTPRNEPEAIRVRRIIRFFKQSMAAKKITAQGGLAGQSSFFLGTPNVFQLEYRTQSTRSGGGSFIDGVNRFKTCALTSFQCDYTPDGFWAAYEAGQPVSTVMSMTFNELEPLYDTDYQEGSPISGRSDLNSVNAGSIGY